MDIEKMLEGINKIFPIDENREPIHPFNQHQYLRREGFRKGVEWALKQVENNGVLDDVINCPNCKGSYVVKDLDDKFLCKDCGSKFFNRVDL
jgi:ribosomal protein S27AE